jgi:hypothetical protein
MKKKNDVSEKINQGFDYKEIKSFEDACKKLQLDPEKLPDVSGVDPEFSKPLIAAYKLYVIFKAINNGWRPDWNDTNQWKYSCWFSVLSSGFGFSHSVFSCESSHTLVGSRLCTNSSEKALYIGSQFKALFVDLLLFSE